MKPLIADYPLKITLIFFQISLFDEKSIMNDFIIIITQL